VIFVTVGTQLPFDRLVKAVDEWAGANGAPAVFAQIGDSRYRPAHMEWAQYLEAAQFRCRIANASLIVSHAGMGNLLAALAAQKPLIVMPRRAALDEIRNDHQLATAKWLRQLTGVTVAEDEAELAKRLRAGDWPSPGALHREASPELLAAIREFIEGG
jgi:exopolysaccharide biosynthesis glucuronosyltransferase PssE